MARPKVEQGKWEVVSDKARLERVERLLHVLTSMTDHEIEHHFDMGKWLARNACGTTGCAAGLCAMDPWFKRRGYGIVFEKAGSRWYWNWLGQMWPESFFGHDLYEKVFTNMFFMQTDQGRDRKPRTQHRMVVAAIRKYLRTMRNDMKERT